MKIICKLLGHKFKYIGMAVIVGPGEPTPEGPAFGHPEDFRRFLCARCGKEKLERSQI